MTTVPTAAVPAAATGANAPPQRASYPLANEDRRSNPEWIRRNTGAWATANSGDGTPGQGQEIDPRYRDRHYSFRDILVSFNPIQHIPVVGQLYRDATGTQLHPAARIIAGGATGPLGAASAFANVALESATGRDLSGHVIDTVLGRQGGAANRQVAGGSWVFDASIGQSPTAPTSSDPTANMATAPAAPAVDPTAAERAASRAPRRRTQQPAPQVAPPRPAGPAIEARAPARGGAAGPGALMARDALAAGPGGTRGPAPIQMLAQGPAQTQAPPGTALAQMANVQGAPAAPSAQGRNIQQYFALSGTRPPGPESARAVPLSPPTGSNPRLGQPVQAGNVPASQPTPQPTPGATPPGAAPGGAPNDRSWFTAAMLHGVERYRDARRAPDNDQPSVDRSE